jgi:DNA-binding NtrC family response regulator
VVPPLRERGSDVVLLARRLLERIAVEMGRPGVRLSGAAEQELLSRSWPGNVRQLRNVLERALLLSDHSTLGPADVTDAGTVALPSAAAGGRITLAEAERRHIEAVLREERGAVASAAEVLGLSRSALYERIKKHGIVTAKGADS